jgi:DNA-binding FadR family transcriptional regulator
MMKKNKLFEQPVERKTLAERLAYEIESMILANELESGVSLPSELELAQQYGASRSVARDATRILMTKGLVDVEHGRGVFVAEPGSETFVESFLLTLTRTEANAWDIRQLEQLIYAQLVSLAIPSASDEELENIHALGLEYLENYLNFHSRWEEESFIPELEQARLRSELLDSLHNFLDALIAACHNKALHLLLKPILDIRTNPNELDALFTSPPPHFGGDIHNFRQLLSSLEIRDLPQSLKLVQDLMATSEEDIEKMKGCPLQSFPFINHML